MRLSFPMVPPDMSCAMVSAIVDCNRVPHAAWLTHGDSHSVMPLGGREACTAFNPFIVLVVVALQAAAVGWQRRGVPFRRSTSL